MGASPSTLLSAHATNVLRHPVEAFNARRRRSRSAESQRCQNRIQSLTARDVEALEARTVAIQELFHGNVPLRTRADADNDDNENNFRLDSSDDGVQSDGHVSMRTHSGRSVRHMDFGEQSPDEERPRRRSHGSEERRRRHRESVWAYCFACSSHFRVRSTADLQCSHCRSTFVQFSYRRSVQYRRTEFTFDDQLAEAIQESEELARSKEVKKTTTRSFLAELKTKKIESLDDDEKNDNSKCSICFESFIIDDFSTELPCNHHFHKSCILEWLMYQSHSCPICRMEFPIHQPDDEEPMITDKELLRIPGTCMIPSN